MPENKIKTDEFKIDYSSDANVLHRIPFQIELNAEHGITTELSETDKVEMVTMQCVFYTGSIFYAIANLSILFANKYTVHSVEEAFNAIENLSEIGLAINNKILNEIETLAENGGQK